MPQPEVTPRTGQICNREIDWPYHSHPLIVVSSEETPLYETPDQEDTGSPADRPISSLVKSRLYISHTLSTFNDRVFEFASILFIVEIFPNTLLPSSVYAIFRSAAAIFIAPYLGRYVDSHERLGVVRRTIGTLQFSLEYRLLNGASFPKVGSTWEQCRVSWPHDCAQGF